MKGSLRRAGTSNLGRPNKEVTKIFQPAPIKIPLLKNTSGRPEIKKMITINSLYDTDFRMLSEESRLLTQSSKSKLPKYHNIEPSSARGGMTPTSANRISIFTPTMTFEETNWPQVHSARKKCFKVRPDKTQDTVHVSRFLFNCKTADTFPSSDQIETDVDREFNQRAKQKLSTASTTGRPFTTVTTHTQSNTIRTQESEWALPFKSCIDMPQGLPMQEVLKGIGTAEPLSRRSKKAKAFESKSGVNNFPSILTTKQADCENLRVGRNFHIKKNVTAKYRSEMKTAQEKKRMIARRVLTNEELILQNKENLLVCVDDDAFNVNYCFVGRLNERNAEGKVARADVEFNIKISEIMKKMRLRSDFKHVYLLDGTPVFELGQIPLTENVIVISNKLELVSVENMIQNDLVRDFYEYGTQKDLSIYSRSHVGSRMASLVQNKKKEEDGFKNILKVFDNGEQLDSEQLERILDAVKPMHSEELSSTIQRVFHKKVIEQKRSSLLDYKKRNSLMDHHNTSRDSQRYDTQDWSKISSSQFDKVLTDRFSHVEEMHEDKEERIQKYLEDEQPISDNPKFKYYQDVCNVYNEGLKEMKFEYEERDDNNALQNIGEDRNDQELQRFSKLEGIGEKLDLLLKRWKKSQKKIDYLELKKILDNLNKGNLSNSSYKQASAGDLEINHLDENLFEAPKALEAGVKKNFIEENKKSLNKNKADIERLHKFNRELFLKNIPKNLQERNLSRRELHSIYILYKALCEITSQRHKEYNLDDGIDYHSFKNGIYQVFLQSDEVAEKIFYTIDFNFSGFLNWDEFINAMVAIRAKTMRDKIDLFIKIADEDGNGNLSQEEIFNLAKICLKKYVTSEGDQFLDDLCEYFTRLIFSSVNISTDEEIPLQAIKDAIISGNEESDLLAMFCGADI